ncbi:DUF397 domain-containing protein [Streptomyces sp. NPDC059786]|uniref:DUF397 domain-containing protein n=1 Tax=Streptomyces sp. NPDC059786 TaxID=3346946 RepID=UPI00366840FB
MKSASFGRPSRPTWVTSSYSNGAGGECVEWAAVERGVLVRDSKRPDAFVIAAGGSSWHCFLRAVRHDTFAS